MAAKEEFVPLSKLSKQEIYQFRMMRWKARTDLGFLCKEILGYPDVNAEGIHAPIVNILQQFPVPNKDQFIENDLIVNGQWVYKPIQRMTSLPGKRRALILDPRGWLKTTINAQSHSIQWIINYPDIAIQIFQSNLEKAEMILGEIKRHFQYNQMFRQLFPEHCPFKGIDDFGTKGKFTTKARNRGITRKEETLMTSSIDAGTAGIHVDVMKFSDIVEPGNIGTPEQMEAVYKSFVMAENLLVGPNYWIDVEGTRYSFCLDGDMRITMSDWSQKPIKDIKVGDEVVGWGWKDGKRYLKRSKVQVCGSAIKETKKYTLESGKEIICTPDHRWWRGKQWAKGPFSNEYSYLGNGHKNKNMTSLRRLLIPVEKENSWEAGWLSGIFDGEGSVSQNLNHPSGAIHITQTMHNPDVIEKIRHSLRALNFEWSESWWSYKDKPEYASVSHHEDRCCFNILGGWKERYRFLAQIAPTRREKLVDTLFAQLMTEEDKLVSVEDAGNRTVYWFQCETGNYIAEGYCSKNSDAYGRIIDSEKNVPENKKMWKIHVRGCYKKAVDNPKFTPEELELPDKKNEKGESIPHWLDEERGFTFDHFEAKRRVDPFIFSTQQLNSPAGGLDGKAIFPVEKGKYPIMISRKNFNENVRVAYYIATVDTAYTKTERSNHSCITIAAFADNGKVYVNEIIHGKFLPDELTNKICELTAPCDALKIKRPFYYGKNLRSIKIEKTGFVVGLMVGLNSYQHMKGIYLPIELLPSRDTNMRKEERIQTALQPFYTSGRLVFLDDIKPWDQLLRELREFPMSQHNDILDTISDLFQEKEWMGREVPKLNHQQFHSRAMERLLGVADPFDENDYLTNSDGSRETVIHPQFSRTGGL